MPRDASGTWIWKSYSSLTNWMCQNGTLQNAYKYESKSPVEFVLNKFTYHAKFHKSSTNAHTISCKTLQGATNQGTIFTFFLDFASRFGLSSVGKLQHSFPKHAGTKRSRHQRLDTNHSCNLLRAQKNVLSNYINIHIWLHLMVGVISQLVTFTIFDIGYKQILQAHTFLASANQLLTAQQRPVAKAKRLA